MADCMAIQLKQQLEPYFVEQMIIHSLKTAYETLVNTDLFTSTIRNRALTALDRVFMTNVTAQIWPKVCKLILALSPRMEQSGFWTGWLSYLQHAWQLCKTFLDRQAEGHIGIQLGIFYQRQGKFEQARFWYETSLACANASHDKATCVLVLNRLGLMAAVQSKATEASEYVAQAFALMAGDDLQQDDSQQDDSQREESFFVLGRVQLSLNQPEKAAEYFQMSFERCQQSGNTHRMASRLNSLGNAYQAQDMHLVALEKYEEAADLWMVVNAPIELAITHMNLGNAYLFLNNFPRSLLYYEEAKPILEKAMNSVNLAKLYNNQGYCYRKQEKWADAEKMYLASLTQWEQIESWVDYANTLDGLGMVYYHQADFDNAIAIFQKALSILSQHTEKQVSAHLAEEITAHLQQAYAR
ncbi:MAG: tetratricopeptide repeat protein [Chloroflexota bacterium]